MKKILYLIDQLIEMEEIRDAEYKNLMVALHNGSAAIGESSMLFHLKVLRNVVKEKANTETLNSVVLDGKTFNVSYGSAEIDNFITPAHDYVMSYADTDPSKAKSSEEQIEFPFVKTL